MNDKNNPFDKNDQNQNFSEFEETSDDFDILTEENKPKAIKESQDKGKSKDQPIEGEILKDDGKILNELEDKGRSSWQDFKKQLVEVLAEANLTVGQLLTYLGCVFFVIVLIVFLVFGSGKFLTFITNFFDRNDIAEEVQPDDSANNGYSEDIPSVNVDKSIRAGIEAGGGGNFFQREGFVDESIIAGLEAGILVDRGRLNLSSREVLAGILLGGGIAGRQFLTDIEMFISQIEKVREALNDDIRIQLEQIENKQERQNIIEVHLSKVKPLLEESRAVFDDLVIQMDNLNAQFEAMVVLKNSREEEFFTHLRALSGDVTNEVLEDFIDISEEQVATRARYNALSAIRELYVPAFRALNTRTTAIDLNKQALIENIQIIQVEGADLDLVIPEP